MKRKGKVRETQKEAFEIELFSYGGVANLDVLLADWKPDDRVRVTVELVERKRGKRNG